MVVIFEEPLCRKYNNSIFSYAFLFRVIVILCIIILPFVISYMTQSFWIKEWIYREQPQVKFKHQLIVIAEGATPGTYYTWSTLPNFNELYSSHLRVPEVKSSELDTNADGLTDEITIQVIFPLNNGEMVYRVAVVTAFEYTLSQRVHLDMETVCVVDHSSPLPGTAVYFAGELKLHQEAPLPVNLHITPSPILPSQVTFVTDVLLQNILLDITRSNVSAPCITPHPVWVSGLSSEFLVNIVLRIPPAETVLYRPSVYETLKYAWIQYLAALTFIYTCFYYLQLLIFRLHVIPTYETLDKMRPEPLFKKLS